MDLRGVDGAGAARFIRGMSLRIPCVAFALVMGGCATSRPSTGEPANLYPHKQEVRAYVDSGRYLADIGAVADRAERWLEQRATQRRDDERLAVVFDLDETLFFNWPQISRQDFGYVSAEWQRWVDAAKAPPIEPVRAVYRTARRLGVAVIFITGRPERDRASTEKNLRAIDCHEHAALICLPAATKSTSAAFKTAARRNVTREGWVIVANVGDQESDLSGGFAERTFKLPNPFYITE